MRYPTTLALAATTLALLPAALLRAQDSTDTPIFREVAQEVGIEFTHFNGMTGDLLFPEMTGQGAAFLDYDLDGDLDLYLVQGNLLGPGKTLADALEPPAPGAPLTDRLYRNDLHRSSDGGLAPRFVDVTHTSGLQADGYGMGVAVGDYDADGWPDLYVTNYGANQLWRNRGDGTFVETTQAAGVEDGRWSTSATFADLNGDGLLDLWIANYVEYDIDNPPGCVATSSRPDYCGPSAFRPQSDSLFLNNGDGSFRDGSMAAGLPKAAGAGLGVAAVDFTGDGRLEVFVANDGQPNNLWIRQEDGTWLDDALLAGVAVNREGQPEASMGVAVGDADNDGDTDLFLTHLAGETNTLYINDLGLFEDRTIETGLAGTSLPFTSFGTGFLDVNNDGWLDLLVASGAVRRQEGAAFEADVYPLQQSDQLYLSQEGRRFHDASAKAGAALSVPTVGRGAAVGDFDNDGDPDVVLADNNGPLRLLRNEIGHRNAWIGVDLGPAMASRRDSRWKVTAERSKTPPLTRTSRRDGSYASASDGRILIGLGEKNVNGETGMDLLFHGLDSGASVGSGVIRFKSTPFNHHLVLSPGTEGKRP